MANLGNTTRPAYVYDAETDTWLPIGVGAHSHDYTSQFIGKTLVDAKGDIVTASANDVPAILSKGSDGTVLVADSTTSTGLAWQPYGAIQVAGKNAVINGGMDIFQRNSFNTLNAYSLDRWYINASTTTTVTQSTAKTTPNSQYMMLMTATGTQQIFAQQAIETRNAIYYAGKTVTLSAYAAGLTTTTNWQMDLSYSTSTDNAITGSWTSIAAASGNPNLTLSSTVTRWSATYNVPSNAKTLRVLFVNNAANITVGQGIYMGDVQLEIGSVATPFSRAGGTIQGELAACHRYYQRYNADSNFDDLGYSGKATSTTVIYAGRNPWVPFRVTPSSVDFANVTWIISWGAATTGISAIALSAFASADSPLLTFTTTGLTAGTSYIILAGNTANAYIGLSAEL